MVVRGGHVRVFEGHLVEGPLPQVTGERQHVGLVYQGQVPLLARPGQVKGKPDTTLHAEAGVDGPLGGDLRLCPLAEETTLPCVGALGIFTDYREVDRDAGADTGGGHERAEVDVEVELEAHPQQ